MTTPHLHHGELLVWEEEKNMQAQKMTRALRCTLIVVLITYLFVIFPGRAEAQDPTMDVVKKMKEVFEPVKPSTRRVVLTVNS